VKGFDDIVIFDRNGHMACVPNGWSYSSLGTLDNQITGYYWTNCYGS
jgi:hypothetical protein